MTIKLTILPKHPRPLTNNQTASQGLQLHQFNPNYNNSMKFMSIDEAKRQGLWLDGRLTVKTVQMVNSSLPHFPSTHQKKLI